MCSHKVSRRKRQDLQIKYKNHWEQLRIYEEARDAWEERDQMGSQCKCKQIYGFSNLLLEPSALQGTILLAAVARSHHTLAPIPFYSCNKRWGGGQWPGSRFAFQCSGKHVQRGWGSVTEDGRAILIGTFSYRNGVWAQCLGGWKAWIGVFPVWGMLQALWFALCALCFPLTLFCSSGKKTTANHSLSGTAKPRKLLLCGCFL